MEGASTSPDAPSMTYGLIVGDINRRSRLVAVKRTLEATRVGAIETAGSGRVRCSWGAGSIVIRAAWHRSGGKHDLAQVIGYSDRIVHVHV